MLLKHSNKLYTTHLRTDSIVLLDATSSSVLWSFTHRVAVIITNYHGIKWKKKRKTKQRATGQQWGAGPYPLVLKVSELMNTHEPSTGRSLFWTHAAAVCRLWDQLADILKWTCEVSMYGRKPGGRPLHEDRNLLLGSLWTAFMSRTGKPNRHLLLSTVQNNNLSLSITLYFLQNLTASNSP